MKILIVCQFYYPENFVIYKIAEELVKRGHEVDVLTGKPNYGYGFIIPEYKKVKEEKINGVNVHRVKLKARKHSRLSIISNYLSFWKNSKKWVKKCRIKYDIVYSMSLSPVTILSAGDLYKKKYNVPHVVHCVDLWPESATITGAVKRKSIFYKILYKWSHDLYEPVDEVLLGSPSYEDYFKNVLKFPDKKYCYIPQPSLVEKSDIASFEFDKDYCNILYCGNLGTIQLIPLIPKAMNLLRDEKIKFHIIGMGPMENKLKDLIDEYHLEDTVIYHGPMIASEASAYFKGADALYVSLKGEGAIGKTIPNKLVMSMSFAKPIIAVLEGDGEMILRESQGGLFSSDNPLDLARTIKEFTHLNKSQKEKMGQNNLTYFEDNLTCKKVVDKIERELLNNIRS